jgi:hypothetical protein
MVSFKMEEDRVPKDTSQPLLDGSCYRESMAVRISMVVAVVAML